MPQLNIYVIANDLKLTHHIIHDRHSLLSVLNKVLALHYFSLHSNICLHISELFIFFHIWSGAHSQQFYLLKLIILVWIMVRWHSLCVIIETHRIGGLLKIQSTLILAIELKLILIQFILIPNTILLIFLNWSRLCNFCQIFLTLNNLLSHFLLFEFQGH